MPQTAQRTDVFLALSESEIYKDYQDAFTKATGLPLALEAPGEHELKLRKSPVAAPFCALMAKTNVSCGACYVLQQRLEKDAKMEPKTLKCFARLCETAVPVRIGANLIAFLHTDHIRVDRPDKARFNTPLSPALRFCPTAVSEATRERKSLTAVTSQTALVTGA